MTTHMVLLWHNEDGTNTVQRRCVCGRWQSRVVPDTATARAQIDRRAEQHAVNPGKERTGA